jgi:hypothetical protein
LLGVAPGETAVVSARRSVERRDDRLTDLQKDGKLLVLL